jgi:glutamate-1-semialdehyde 2,1-aminomutase
MTTALRKDGMLERARRVIPNGASSGGRALFTEQIVRAKGAHVWNAEGKEYVDHLLSFGPIVLGHCDRRVNDAVAAAAATCDLTWVGPQPGEVELAEMVCEHMPCADKVAFCTSGTDATLHAVHLVRAATGRVKLVKFHGSYHGWHDHLAVGSRFTVGRDRSSAMQEPNAAGLHPGAVADVLVVEWNDLDAVRELFDGDGDEIAAVFAEPYVHSYGCVAPAPGFLEGLRDLCTRYGSALVFDEVKTGFRQHVGGYQAVCGVTPDLTAFGKAIANGYAVAGIAGRAELMDILGSASETNATLEGTYNAAPYGMAAGIATLSVLRDGGVERLNELGDVLRAALGRTIAEVGVDACVAGWGSEWMVYFRADPPRNYREALSSDAARGSAFCEAMHEKGILQPPFPLSDRRLCLATTRADVERTVEAAGEVLGRLHEQTES